MSHMWNGHLNTAALDISSMKQSFCGRKSHKNTLLKNLRNIHKRTTKPEYSVLLWRKERTAPHTISHAGLTLTSAKSSSVSLLLWPRSDGSRCFFSLYLFHYVQSPCPGFYLSVHNGVWSRLHTFKWLFSERPESYTQANRAGQDD